MTQPSGPTGRVPRVYFYCRDDEGNLLEDVIALAEGLRELGVPFSGSCDYWLETPEPGSFLIRRDPAVGPDDCDIVVVSYTWPFWIRSGTFELVRRPLPVDLFRLGRRYFTVYMDNHDGHRTVSWEPEYRQFDLILRSKLNCRAWHPQNMKPSALGLTRRIVEETRGAPAFGDRREVLLWNFGASHPYPHGARDLARASLLPRVERLFPIDRTQDDLRVEPPDPYCALMWRQTGGRFSRPYYQRLMGAQAVACFCGEIIPSMPFREPERYLVGGNRAKIRRMFYELLGAFDPRPKRSVQWDSFRFWEALSAGCLAFNLDLARYGVDLPVMPENWTHYVGLDLDDLEPAMERLAAEKSCLPEIAAAGREWALRHYSPKAAAGRLLAAAGWNVPQEHA